MSERVLYEIEVYTPDVNRFLEKTVLISEDEKAGLIEYMETRRVAGEVEDWTINRHRPEYSVEGLDSVIHMIEQEVLS